MHMLTQHEAQKLLPQTQTEHRTVPYLFIKTSRQKTKTNKNQSVSQHNLSTVQEHCMISRLQIVHNTGTLYDFPVCKLATVQEHCMISPCKNYLQLSDGGLNQWIGQSTTNKLIRLDKISTSLMMNEGVKL